MQPSVPPSAATVSSDRSIGTHLPSERRVVRIVTRAPFSLVHLSGFPGPYVPLDLVEDALRRSDEPVDWLVMPRLEQPEVSVDCLTGTDNRVRMAVGRTKNGRRRGFTLHEQWLEPARRIAEGFGLHHPHLPRCSPATSVAASS